MTFRERYMMGDTEFDEIFDLTGKWNFSDDPRTLREYLGLTAREEDVWVSESDEALEELMEKERNTKIFFTDLDGTLLDDEKHISAGNQQAIDELLHRGHVVVISTGRALASAKIQAQRLGLTKENCYIICFNGGQVYDAYHQKLIYQKSVPMEYVRTVFDRARDFGISVQTYSDTHVISETDNEQLHAYSLMQKIPCQVADDITKALPHDPAKILVLDFDRPDRVQEFRDSIRNWCQGKLDIFLSHPSLLEMVSPGVSKGSAVRFLCDYLGIPIANSVAAGDAENDLPMIEACGIGAVMCNGEQQLKDKADYVTEADNNQDGVAEILRKFILK
ncbi:MAG: Cof-type HAD-IIB family hydrolase [Lachnospiraceae bacterium]|nr:Cof-type HAD-IIB family hydrolase [Lachnospiraceae bacterium]